VTTRALAPFIETERAMVGAKLEEAKASALERAQEADHPVAALPHHAKARAAGALRSFTRGFATVPDRLSNAARRAYVFLSTPDGRQRFRKGIVDPHDLTAEQKAVTLFVGTCAVLAALVVAHFIVTLAAPDMARPWRTQFFLFLYGFVTSVGVPLPIEPVLIPAALSIGPVLAIVTTLLAKIVAGWMVFFLGDEVNDKLREKAEKKPWVRKGLDWSERFAERFGIFAVALFIATPGLPDLVALYIFGSLRMRLWKFLLGVAIGGAVLYTAVTFGLLALLGLSG
jgi:membrane protein YqaA with SNARE-associated domain